MSKQVTVNSDNYPEMLATRDDLEDVIGKAQSVLDHTQDMYNRINEAIEDYENEQSALDV